MRSIPNAWGIGLVMVLLAALVSTKVGAAPSPTPVHSTTAVTPLIPYQGRLLDPTTGNPKADGTYPMTFRIYDAATGGNVLWTELKDVTVSKGLFTTYLGDTTALDPTIFDGNDRWLGVKVGTDPETSPRMPLAFVPYAFWALNADTLDGQDASDFAAAGHNHDTDYVDDNANEVDNADVADGALSPAKISGTAWTSINDGPGSGLDADTLDGQDASDFAAAGHNHDTAYVNSAGPDSISGNSFSPILTVTQSGGGPAIQAEGSVQADSIVYNTPRSHTLSITAEAFQPGSNVDYFNTYSNGGAYITATGGHSLVAPVYLPDGATVTKMTAYFKDTSSDDMTVYFHRLSHTAGNFINLAQVSSSGTSGYYSKTDTTISSPTIDNVGGGYAIYAYSAGWSSSLKLMGVEITYTIDEAP